MKGENNMGNQNDNNKNGTYGPIAEFNSHMTNKVSQAPVNKIVPQKPNNNNTKGSDNN